MSVSLMAASIIVNRGEHQIGAQGFARGCLNCECLIQVSQIIV